MAIVFAEQIEGPHRVMTRKDNIRSRIKHPALEDPSVTGNDASLLEDESGAHLFFSNRNGIYGMPITLPESKPAGDGGQFQGGHEIASFLM